MSTILVVDDDGLCREAVSKLLEYDGFTVLRACHGREAWALMHDHTPDLVLLDLIMPEMHGATLLRMIRRSERWHDLPVILLTGVDDDDVLLERARELKIQDLVPKTSFDFNDLLSCIRRHLPSAVT
jgi:CheY-like chemotaxis protein